MRRDSTHRAARAVADASISRGPATYRVLVAVAAAALLCALPAFGQIERVRAASLQPGSCVDGAPRAVLVVDSSASSTCSPSSTGTAEALCCCLDGTWAACASGGSAANSFETIVVPTGTSPVADSPTDTLTITQAGTVGGINIVGDASSDLITLSLLECEGGEILKMDTGSWACAEDEDSGGGGGSVALDLGDTGSNDSSAITEIATIHDDYGVVTEPSANKMLIDFAKVAPYRKYDPDRPPTSCHTCDEFIGGETLSYSWQNQESSTATAEMDGLTLHHPADSTGFAAYYFTGPDGSATDWAMSTKVRVLNLASFNAIAIGVLATGTEASPTLLYFQALYSNGTTPTVGARSATSYTSAQTTLGTNVNVLIPYIYLQILYVSSTKEMTFRYSWDGRLWNQNHSLTLAAHPTTSFFLMVQALNAGQSGTGHIEFIRIRTDATGTTAPYPCGE